MFGLLAAACGSEAAIEASSDVGSDGSSSVESDASSDSSSDAGAEAEGPTPAATAGDEGGESTESEGPAVATEHFFPDLNTVNIADGTTLNLAEELAGGDTPVLLWFFAPH